MARYTGTTTQRGLGHPHQALKRRLMVALYTNGPRPCRRCGQDMHHPARCCKGHCPACRLDLGHLTPRALGGTLAGSDLEHRHCNRAAGAALGNRLRARTTRPRHSRRW